MSSPLRARRAEPPDHTAPTASTLYDEATLSRLRNLVIHAHRLAATGLAGEHRSRRRGLSPEFSDFKPYAPGDDFRRIDWKTYARLDELFVRESETTTEYDIHILIDASPSMDWTSDDDRPTKLRYALQLAGAIAYLSLWHFDRITIGSLSTENSRRIGPLQGRNHILPVFRFLEGQTCAPGAAVSPSLERYVHSKSRPGILIAISDCLDDDVQGLEHATQRLAAQGWETCLLRIEDPAERDPALLLDPDANFELADSEAAARLQVSGNERTLNTYRTDRHAWADELAALGTGSQRLHYLTVATDEPAESVVFSRLRILGVVH